MEENTGNTTNNKTIMIIGHVDHGRTCLTAAKLAAMKDKSIVLVEDLKDINTQEVKNNPFDKEPTMIIKNYRVEPLLNAYIDMQEHNPWPSPKGRKGKRKW